MHAGTWAGSYSGAFTGRFTIDWSLVGSKLVGTIQLSNPHGKYGITGSVKRGSAIKFGVVDVGATYTGSVSGWSLATVLARAWEGVASFCWVGSLACWVP